MNNNNDCDDMLALIYFNVVEGWMDYVLLNYFLFLMDIQYIHTYMQLIYLKCNRRFYRGMILSTAVTADIFLQ